MSVIKLAVLLFNKYNYCIPCSYFPRHGTNADRQLYVNHVAESIGSGTGTADEYKVPGAYGSAYGYGYGYRNGYHGNGYGYGNNFYGNRYGYYNGHYGTDYYGGDYYPKH